MSKEKKSIAQNLSKLVNKIPKPVRDRLGKVFVIVAIVMFLGLGVYIFFKNNQLQSQAMQLKNLPTDYKLKLKKLTEITFTGSLNTLKDLDALLATSKSQQQKWESYYSDHRSHYEYFLKELFFPSMDIWLKPYDKDLYDFEVRGKRFFKENQFLDVNLLAKWWSFIKYGSFNFGNAPKLSNEVKNLRLGGITFDKEDNTLLVKIDSQFEVQERKNFLYLIDLLSLTTNKANVSLFSEFVYYLWQQIRINNLSKLEWDAQNLWKSVDEIIGEILLGALRENYKTIEFKPYQGFKTYKVIKPWGERLVFVLDWQDNWWGSGVLFLTSTDVIGLYDMFFEKSYIEWLNTKNRMKDALDTQILKKYIDRYLFGDTNVIRLFDTGEPLVIIENRDDKYIVKKDYSKAYEEIVSDEVVKEAMRNSAACEEGSDDLVCAAKFRNKFRDLPFMAYELTVPSYRGYGMKVADLLRWYPPLMKLERFVFRKKEDVVKGGVGDVFDVQLSFYVYGRGISDDEVEKIKQLLGQKCLGKKTFNLDLALAQLQKKLNFAGEDVDSKEVVNLLELKNIFEQRKEEFDKKNPYDQLVILLESYQMLKKANLCESK